MSAIKIDLSMEITDRASEPLRMTSSIGSLAGPDGEQIGVLASFPVPLTIILRGEKLVGTINLEPLIQKAALHITKSNAEESK